MPLINLPKSDALNKLREKREVCNLQSKTPKAKIRNNECGLQPETPQKNPKEVTEIVNSMKRRYAPVKDSEVSANGSNNHEINRRYDEPKKGVCPNKRTLKGGYAPI